MKFSLCGSLSLLGGTLCNFLVGIYTNFDRKKNYTELHREKEFHRVTQSFSQSQNHSNTLWLALHIIVENT
jgi:hypothetical protein